MTSTEVRQRFFEFFESHEHKIVASAPIVNKNDPTLLFTNAGMNQFKDYFLGNKKPEFKRIADTQKCLRVSGKHNDLEEVGLDSYHHTMFEMLGNWSFGDYFKAEAIEWAWKLLTEVYGLDEDRLYVTVFEGDESDGLSADKEAADLWSKIIPVDRILYFNKKDNFWEMGDTGPCGPCSEIHIDLRSEEDRLKGGAHHLVNMDNPLVVEIWNLVFIQFNRKADGSLEELPDKHIDTGMGFERLCMAVQGKQSNYDTDVFTPFISWLEIETGKKYEAKYDSTAKKDIAFRVIVDHIRAVCFTVADGQLPSNTGAGYVIRRILRRAVRYYYSFLDRKEPLLYKLVPLLAELFKETFPELHSQQSFVSKIVHEEEKSFLRTLDGGLKRLNNIDVTNGVLDGKVAFELYDTYGFPIDLTRLIGLENGWTIDEIGFKKALSDQKNRSRADAKREAGDWIEVHDIDAVDFIGYDFVNAEDVRVIKYRTLKVKNDHLYQLVLDKTPFYAESGGQVGDTGILNFEGEIVNVLDTIKENDLIIHLVDKIPNNAEMTATAQINYERRISIESNHSATHLMHSALREVLGHHVHQKGSLVNEHYLRFDFSHFEKMTDEQIKKVENIVNRKIRENIAKREDRHVPIDQAKGSGAMMLFGEKYGDYVRVITFDPLYSIELCGGCHVNSTGKIGLFKIKSESAIAAGVRRIEAVTGEAALQYSDHLIDELNTIKALFKNAVDTPRQVAELIESNKTLEKQLNHLKLEKAVSLKYDLIPQFKDVDKYKVLTHNLGDIEINDAKTLAYSINQKVPDSIILFATTSDEKVNLLLLIDKEFVNDTINAGKMIKSIAKHIQGGGGGQPFFATAGGKYSKGIESAFDELLKILMSEI